MSTRTFTQTGYVYGSGPATVVAAIDGNQVFSGTVAAHGAEYPTLPDFAVQGENIFTWTNTVEFAGTQSFTVTVTGASLLLTHTVADNIFANNAAYTGAFYSYEQDGVTITDPFTAVTIDGVPVARGSDSTTYPGQWYYEIPAGSTFAATLNVSAGGQPNPA